MGNIDLKLNSNPTLKDFQEYVAEMVKVRRFEHESAAEIFMLLLEECGEMAKADRKATNIKADVNHDATKENLGHEVADVLIYLLDICNIYGIDLEKAFREKEEINKQRTWK